MTRSHLPTLSSQPMAITYDQSELAPHQCTMKQRWMDVWMDGWMDVQGSDLFWEGFQFGNKHSFSNFVIPKKK